MRWGLPWPASRHAAGSGHRARPPSYLVLLVIDVLPLVIDLDGQLFNPPLQFPVGGLQNRLLPKAVGVGACLRLSPFLKEPLLPPRTPRGHDPHHRTGQEPGQSQRTGETQGMRMSAFLQLPLFSIRRKVLPKR